MAVKVYCGTEEWKHESEYKQFIEVYNLLNNEYGGSEEPVYVLANFRLPKHQIDAVVLMKKGPIIIDFKAYKGIIKGSENGDWKVQTGSGELVSLEKNLFEQLSNQRYDFGKKLADLQEKDGILQHTEEKDLKYQIQAWGYFENGSGYDTSQVGKKAWIWFDILWKDKLLNKIRTFRGADYSLEESDMVDIVRALNLREYSKINSTSIKTINLHYFITTQFNVHLNSFISKYSELSTSEVITKGEHVNFVERRKYPKISPLISQLTDFRKDNFLKKSVDEKNFQQMSDSLISIYEQTLSRERNMPNLRNELLTPLTEIFIYIDNYFDNDYCSDRLKNIDLNFNMDNIQEIEIEESIDFETAEVINDPKIEEIEPKPVDITFPQEIKMGLTTSFDILIEQINRISPSFDKTMPQYILTIASELKGGIDEVSYDTDLHVKSPERHGILMKELMVACRELIEGFARAVAQRQNMSLYSDIGSKAELANLNCPPLVLRDDFVNKIRNLYGGHSSFESASGIEYDKASSALYKFDDSLIREMGKLNTGPLASIWNVCRDTLQNKGSDAENESICSLARGCLVSSVIEGLNFILNDPSMRKKLEN